MSAFWEQTYGNQNFQTLIDAVRHIVRQHGYDVINYCDDVIGFGTLKVTQKSYDCLYKILQKLGFTISQKKLVPPPPPPAQKSPAWEFSLIQKMPLYQFHPKNYKKFAILFKNGPGKNLVPKGNCSPSWDNYYTCTSMYIRLGCFRTGCSSYLGTTILKNPSILLLNLNGSKTNWPSIMVALDAYLTGFGAISGNYVYRLKIDRGYGNLHIVPLEMLNILQSLCISLDHEKKFNQMWQWCSGKGVEFWSHLWPLLVGLSS